MNATARSFNILASRGETEYCIVLELLGGGQKTFAIFKDNEKPRP